MGCSHGQCPAEAAGLRYTPALPPATHIFGAYSAKFNKTPLRWRFHLIALILRFSDLRPATALPPAAAASQEHPAHPSPGPLRSGDQGRLQRPRCRRLHPWLSVIKRFSAISTPHPPPSSPRASLFPEIPSGRASLLQSSASQASRSEMIHASARFGFASFPAWRTRGENPSLA